MPVTRRKFSKCGHKGFGVSCHRCEQAEKIEGQVAKLKDGEKKDKLKAEVKRLRAIPGRMSEPVFSSTGELL